MSNRSLEVPDSRRTPAKALDAVDVAETMESLGYAVSHDLGAPARAVTGFISLAVRKLPKEGPHVELLDVAHKQGRLLQEMLVAMARYIRALGAPSPPKATCSLSDVVRAVTEMLGDAIETSGAVIQVDPLPNVRESADDLTQVVAELIDNALLYVDDGATPQIRLSVEVDDAGEATLAVRDEGIGIPRAQTLRAFKPLSRLCPPERFAGLGMGLAWATLYAQRQGLSLTLDAPTHGKGTVAAIAGLQVVE